jgi:tetratricopeptide (TPR) repeat protein
LAAAARWQQSSPGEVVPLVALGEALEAAGEAKWAARAYGSMIDLFPSRTDFRRYAGERLERIASFEALALASDSYAKALEQRPDHPSSHRLHAWALVKRGRYTEAFDVLEKALGQDFDSNRYPSVTRILREDLGLIAAAWINAIPSRASAVRGKLAWAGAELAVEPSLRFVLHWESDANDVDFHVYDHSGHAYFSQRTLPSGGMLYDDVTQGYGPECFTVLAAPSARSASYRLQAHYFQRGPMGYGMGKVQVIEHDGRGGLSFDERPFLIMVDDGYVDLGEVSGRGSPARG